MQPYKQDYRTNGTPVTDPRLPGDMGAGVEAAWLVFFSVYASWLAGMARRKGLGLEVAENQVQQTLVSVSKHISNFVYDPAKGKFSQWLLTILKHKISNHRRAGYHDPLGNLRSTPHEETKDDPLDSIAAPPQYEVVEEVAFRELQALLEEACAELERQSKPEHYTIFVQYALNEGSASKMAAKFGLQPGSVYCIASRMWLELRSLMRSKLGWSPEGVDARS